MQKVSLNVPNIFYDFGIGLRCSLYALSWLVFNVIKFVFLCLLGIPLSIFFLPTMARKLWRLKSEIFAGVFILACSFEGVNLLANNHLIPFLHLWILTHYSLISESSNLYSIFNHFSYLIFFTNFVSGILEIGRYQRMNSKKKNTEVYGNISEVRAELKENQSKLQTAIEILGEDLIGPEEVEKTWGVRPEEIPDIPFSREELERAKEMGQVLVLRVDRTEDGKPMSLEAMNNILAKRWEKKKKGGLLSTADEWKDFMKESYSKDAPRTGWALTSKELLEGSTSKNYIEQTEVIIETLQKQVFKDIEMPEEYEEAIREFEANNKGRLTKFIGENWQQAAKELAELKISQLARGSIQETIYDLALYYDKNGKRLLPNVYTWSNSRSPDGRLVHLGLFGAGGVYGCRWSPGDCYSNVGVLLSRRL